jgi:hypothetical protein
MRIKLPYKMATVRGVELFSFDRIKLSILKEKNRDLKKESTSCYYSLTLK